MLSKCTLYVYPKNGDFIQLTVCPSDKNTRTIETIEINVLRAFSSVYSKPSTDRNHNSLSLALNSFRTKYILFCTFLTEKLEKKKKRKKWQKC